VIGEEKANELRTLRETGTSPEILEEKTNADIAVLEFALINRFYHALESADSKKEAASKISKQCCVWLPDVTSDEKRTQLETFHHTDHAECKKRVAEYKARLLPQERQTAMAKYWDFCEHVWYIIYIKKRIKRNDNLNIMIT
jgi:hypothetical protein